MCVCVHEKWLRSRSSEKAYQQSTITPTVMSSLLPIVTFAKDVAVSMLLLKAVIIIPFIAQTNSREISDNCFVKTSRLGLGTT